jgi:hypothetical protein
VSSVDTVANPVKKKLVNELLYFSILLFVGVLLLPGGIYLVGDIVFGDYDGGFGVFFQGLMSDLFRGNGPTWFLVMSPYLAVQSVRLSLFAAQRTKLST